MIVTGTGQCAVSDPTWSLIPQRHYRRATSIARMAGAALEKACGEMILRPLPLVFGSVLGEIDTTVTLLDMMGDADGELSPLRFQTSVHNAAVSTLAIACGNTANTTAIAAGADTLAMTLLEALGLLHGGAPVVGVILAELDWPAGLYASDHRSGAVALRLEAQGSGGPTLELVRRFGAAGGGEVVPAQATLELLRAVDEGNGTVRLGADWFGVVGVAS